MSGTREKIYRYVRQRLLLGDPPTIREVQHAMGLKAVESARSHLQALVEEGRLQKREGKSRGYELPGEEFAPVRQVPLLGVVQAGAFTTAIEEPEGYIPVEASYPGEELFALRVRGLSMRDAGILPEDLVIARWQQRADNGQIVVALVDDEATVKRLRLRKKVVELHPENPDFPVLRPPPDEVRILGRVVQVRRYLEPP